MSGFCWRELLDRIRGGEIRSASRFCCRIRKADHASEEILAFHDLVEAGPPAAQTECVRLMNMVHRLVRLACRALPEPAPLVG